MLHQLRQSTPAPTRRRNDRAVCHYMKMITPRSWLRSVREGTVEITVRPTLPSARVARSTVWWEMAHRRWVANDRNAVRAGARCHRVGSPGHGPTWEPGPT